VTKVKESQRWLRHAFCDPWCSLEYNVPSPLPLQAIAHGQNSLPAPDDDGIDPANVHFLDSLAEASLVVRVCRQGHTLVQAVRLIGHYLVFIAGKLLGERSFWAVWIDLQTRRPAFRGEPATRRSFASRLRNITPSQPPTTAQRAEDFRSSSTRSCEVLRRVA
jgi:hypothetical protein